MIILLHYIFDNTVSYKFGFYDNFPFELKLLYEAVEVRYIESVDC